ncbi:MAG: nucleotidyltransferase family protein [Chloroflexi bacterium]|nr:nucleotidyltransferase family protein [Chloroflexota bacterium]MCY4245971.1 nucleotidyltransferase family protein [Chloroflexota bacterium]
MDGIILAAGHGKRMRPLTLESPKPLLQLRNRPLLEWSLRSLCGIVRRVLVVVNYRKEQIAAFMATQRIFTDYALVEQQPTPLGTGHALRCCQPHLRSEDFLVINGDDLFPRAGLLALSRAGYGILSMRRADYSRYGVIQRDDKGDFMRIDEKPPAERYPSPALCSIGAYKLQSGIFDSEPPASARGEVELTDMVTAIARRQRVEVVDSPWWLPIGDPEALAAAQAVDVMRHLLAL